MNANSDLKKRVGDIPGVVGWIFDQVEDKVPVLPESRGDAANHGTSDQHDESNPLQRKRVQQRICFEG